VVIWAPVFFFIICFAFSQVSILLPHSTFSERLVRVYFRSTEDQDKTKEQRKVLKEAFEMWEQAQKQLEVSEAYVDKRTFWDFRSVKLRATRYVKCLAFVKRKMLYMKRLTKTKKKKEKVSKK